jgi:putative transposase
MGIFNNVHIWTYRYLLKRIEDVAEEHGVRTIFVDERGSSPKYPVHRTNKCGRRIKRGLFKCTKISKIFNADLVGAYNIPITPSPGEPANVGSGWLGYSLTTESLAF